MVHGSQAISIAQLRELLVPFCRKHRIRRLEVFGSAARESAKLESDLDLLVTPNDSPPPSTSELLEMAGEVGELLGKPVDFVLRRALENSPNRCAREHIFNTAVCIYAE